MKLPTERPRDFILDMRQTLLGSMQQRGKDAQNWDALFWSGATNDKITAAIINIIRSRILTQVGNLFSPDRLSFRLEYELGAPDEVLMQAQHAASFLSRELREVDADLEFGDAVELAVRHGWAGGQLIWEDDKLCANAIRGEAFGVLDETCGSLAEQPAFMVSYNIPAVEFEQMVMKFPGGGTIASKFDGQEGESAAQMSDSTRLVLGLNQPIGSGSTSQAGFINLLPRPPFIPSANSIGRQVAIDAIWLKQDDGTWATVYVVEGNETIGTDRWRNFMAVDEKGAENAELAKRTPYFGVCAYPVKGSFFGRSQIADIYEPQNFLRKKLADADHILDMQSDPAHVGFGAINTAEIYRQALREPGGWVTESGPNAKVTPFKPDMPESMLQWVEAVVEGASDAANQPPVVQGRGESGVRAGAHAETLMTAASSRERRPAQRIVRQCGDMGDLAMAILRVKCAEQIPDGKDGTFILDSLDDGYHVYCNGHTASPLFAAEYRANVQLLVQTGGMDAEGVLDAINPEGYDTLLAALKRRQKQQQQTIQSLPPEDRVKVLTHSGGRHR